MGEVDRYRYTASLFIQQSFLTANLSFAWHLLLVLLVLAAEYLSGVGRNDSRRRGGKPSVKPNAETKEYINNELAFILRRWNCTLEVGIPT